MELKFKCDFCPETDSLTVQLGAADVLFRADDLELGQHATVVVGPDEVRQLRDALTDWLGRNQ